MRDPYPFANGKGLGQAKQLFAFSGPRKSQTEKPFWDSEGLFAFSVFRLLFFGARRKAKRATFRDMEGLNAFAVFPSLKSKEQRFATGPIAFSGLGKSKGSNPFETEKACLLFPRVARACDT